MDLSVFEEITEKYGPYVKELKKKVIYFCYFFAFVFFTSFALAGPLVKFAFRRFVAMGDIQIVVASPFQFFSVAFDISLFLAIIVTFPIAVVMIFSFLKSALVKKEQVLMRKMAVASLFLFICGFLFGMGTMYYAIMYLAGFNANLGLANMWNMSLLVSQILLGSVMLGVCFQYPIILTILIRWGIISVDTLRKKRRWAMMVTVIVASILPPPEVISTIVMLIPLLALYEITIIINRNQGTREVEVPDITNNKFNIKKYV